MGTCSVVVSVRSMAPCGSVTVCCVSGGLSWAAVPSSETDSWLCLLRRPGLPVGSGLGLCPGSPHLGAVCPGKHSSVPFLDCSSPPRHPGLHPHPARSLGTDTRVSVAEPAKQGGAETGGRPVGLGCSSPVCLVILANPLPQYPTARCRTWADAADLTASGFENSRPVGPGLPPLFDSSVNSG